MFLAVFPYPESCIDHYAYADENGQEKYICLEFYHVTVLWYWLLIVLSRIVKLIVSYVKKIPAAKYGWQLGITPHA
jgi:hypothetical protein